MRKQESEKENQKAKGLRDTVPEAFLLTSGGGPEYEEAVVSGWCLSTPISSFEVWIYK